MSCYDLNLNGYMPIPLYMSLDGFIVTYHLWDFHSKLCILRRGHRGQHNHNNGMHHLDGIATCKVDFYSKLCSLRRGHRGWRNYNNGINHFDAIARLTIVINNSLCDL